MVDQVIAGRYRVDRHLPDDIAVTYRATDLILGRTVRLRVVDNHPGVLDAARRAAMVTDARLVRVLDVGTISEDRGYVVTEQVQGSSLSEMLTSGHLHPDQARTIIGEAASALEVARRRGVHHLALRPSSVHMARDGRVVLTGLAIDAALLGRGETDEAASSVDSFDLVRLLYAALTGAWPVLATDQLAAGIPRAPLDAQGRPLSVAEMAPNVDAALADVCDSLISGQPEPELPSQVARMLEPWGEVRAFGHHDIGPATPTRLQETPAPAAPATAFGASGMTQPSVTPYDEPQYGVQPPVSPQAAPYGRDQGTEVWPAESFEESRSTGFYASAVPSFPADAQPPAAVQPPPAASHGAVRREPGTDPVPVVRSRQYSSTPPNNMIILAGVLVGVLVVSVVAVAALFNRPDTPVVAVTDPAASQVEEPQTAVESSEPTPTTTTFVPTGEPFVVESITSYDPADTEGEHAELVAKLFDGDPNSEWYTRTYSNDTFGGLKPGVALVVTLSTNSEISSVTLDSVSYGGNIEIREFDGTNPAGGAVLASGAIDGTTTFELDSPTQMTSFVIWVGQLPTAEDGAFRLNVSEVTIH